MKQLCCILLFIMLRFALQAQQLLILDSGAARVNANITFVNIHDNTKSGNLNANGSMPLPSPGTYKISIRAIGCEDYATILTFNAPNEIITIQLKRATVVIDDIVVTAQIGTKTAKNSVIPVKIIDSKKIALLGAQNLRDVLTNEAGIRISQDNILGSSMSMQGISGENVKILIDGVPMIGRLNGNIDLSQIDMSNVDHIEIIEGPMSVNYGTNALGGVINIITKKGNKINSLTLKTYYESIGTYNTGLTANTHYRKLNIQLTASRNYFDGWSASEPYEALPIKHLADTNRYKTWKPKMQYNAGINLGYKIGYWNIGYKSNYFDEQILNRGRPRAPFYEDAFDDTYKTYRLDNALQVSYSRKPKSIFNTQFAYNYYKRIKNTYYIDLTNLENQLSPARGEQDTTKFNLVNIRSSYNSYYKKLSYEAGADINIEGAGGQRIKNNSQSLGDYAIFGITEYSLSEALTLRGGFRAAYNTKYKAPVLPSFNAKWFINTKNIIRFSYARGFKAPGLKELYFYFVDVNHNIVGNEKLDPEKSQSFNLQYNYVTMLKKSLLKFETKAFYNRIDNLITLADIQGLSYTYVNIGLYKTTGVQTSTELAVKNIRLTAGINYVGRYNQLSASKDIAAFSFSPEYTGSFNYNWVKYKTRFNLFYKFNGKLPAYFLDADKNVFIQNIGSYHWADASITRTFCKSLALGLGIKNLFNVQNISTTTADNVHPVDNKMPIGAGRFYFFNLNYTLQK